MLRRLLCSRSGSCSSVEIVTSCLRLVGHQRAFGSDTITACGPHGHAAQPRTSLLPLLDALPRSMHIPAATHAQQAAAALWSTPQHAKPAVHELQHCLMQQWPSKAAELHARHAAAEAARSADQQPQLMSYQLRSLQEHQQIAQLMAPQPDAQQAALAARMQRWAQRSAAVEWQLDSVRRKRKHKMNKHKHRKRRKAQRHKN